MSLQVDLGKEQIDNEPALYQYTEDSWQKRCILVGFKRPFNGSTDVVLA